MLEHVSKSARYLTLSTCLSGLSGCASDGGLGEMVVVGGIIAAASGDTGTMLALGAAAAGSVVVASALSDDPAPNTPPTASQPAGAAPIAYTPALAPTAPVQAPAVQPAIAASTVNYCYAYLSVKDQRGSTCSPVAVLNDTDSSGAIFQTRLNSYVDKVKQAQPGIWGDFEYAETVKMYNAFIYQMKPKAGFEAKKQDAGLICYPSMLAADASLNTLKKNDSTVKIVGWP